MYGAGEAGAAVARLADRDPTANVAVVGFIDDDPAKTGKQLEGRPILGGLETLASAVDHLGVEQLLVAMGAAPPATIGSAFDAARALGLDVRTVPNLRRLEAGDLRPAMIQPIQLDDLLPRRVAEPDAESLAAHVRGASVLITGGAGSIGRELGRQVLALQPARLTIVDHHEEGIWATGRELTDLRPSGRVALDVRLADVRAPQAVLAAFGAARPDVVFHAAALKHVPIVEDHPSEGALTNVGGTRNVLSACEELDVARFVLISTDKAVNPTGAMGQTKRLAELLTLASAERVGRPYVAVRFGNVLGSSGSVVPTFLSQLERRAPITITDPEATRFFMTVSEAVGLILQAGAIATRGEVFVLDMGEPIRITELAGMLVRLAGFDPNDVPIRYTGLRPGERLHETLFFSDEIVDSTSHPGIFRVRASARDEQSVATAERLAKRIEVAAEARDDEEVRLLLALVSQPSEDGPASTSLDGGPATRVDEDVARASGGA